MQFAAAPHAGSEFNLHACARRLVAERSRLKYAANQCVIDGSRNAGFGPFLDAVQLLREALEDRVRHFAGRLVKKPAIAGGNKTARFLIPPRHASIVGRNRL